MINLLRQLESEGWVRGVSHRSLPLIVWNYSPSCQFEKKWGEYPILRSCRGLVTDLQGNIVSHPLLKFHNWEELHISERPVAGDKIEITLKMDGSLIIISRYQGQLIFNTRGSFNSDQALEAEKLFYKIYNPDWIEDGITYLFEYVAPDNRIVVAYSESNLVHLARIETATGRDLDRDNRFDCVEVFELNGGLFGEELYDLFKSLENTVLKDKEGFVIRQVIDEPRQNFRMKFKTETYRNLHSIVTNTSSVDIWEYLRDGKSFDDIVELLPDEFFEWLTKTKDELIGKYCEIEEKAKDAYNDVKYLPSRKEQAMQLMQHHKDLSAIVFKMLDCTSYSGTIWNMIKPKRVCPFQYKDEE